MPMDMMGNATMLLDPTYFRLRDHLGLSPIPPIRSGSTANYYDERILEHLGIDFRRVFLPPRRGHDASPDSDGTFVDPWGVRYKRAGLYVHVVYSPLAKATTVRDVENFRWPQAEEMFSTEGLAEQAQRSYAETDCALVARNPLTAGFLDRAQQLMGATQFLTTLALAPEIAEAIVAHLLDVYQGVYTLFLDTVGPFVQIVEVADDLGTQNSLLISPATYRRIFKPAERVLYELIHAKAPQARLFRHCDGAIEPLIPDLIEVGVDVLNPTQTSARGMDAQRLKAAYGQQLTFHGAIEGMAGPVEALVAEVRQRIEALAPGGGYVFASCNHMTDVPPENILAMVEAAREYGNYKSG